MITIARRQWNCRTWIWRTAKFLKITIAGKCRTWKMTDQTAGLENAGASFSMSRFLQVLHFMIFSNVVGSLWLRLVEVFYRIAAWNGWDVTQQQIYANQSPTVKRSVCKTFQTQCMEVRTIQACSCRLVLVLVLQRLATSSLTASMTWDNWKNPNSWEASRNTAKRNWANADLSSLSIPSQSQLTYS